MAVAKRTINRKPKHKIELGPPGTIESTYTRRQFLSYEMIVVDGGSLDSAKVTLDHVEHNQPAGAMDETFTFAQWAAEA